MELLIFIKAVFIGVAVSAPMGPVAVLSLQRMLSKNILVGYLAAMGAVFADLFYATIAGFSVSYIVDFMTGKQFYIRSIGGIMLIVVGTSVFFSNTIKQFKNQNISKSKVFGDFLSAFFLTLSNPVTLIFFGAVFAGILPAEEQNSVYYTSIILVGIFVGANVWWSTLAFIVSRFRRRIKLRYLYWINKVSGILIAILGIISIFSLIYLKHPEQTPMKDISPQSGKVLERVLKMQPMHDFWKL